MTKTVPTGREINKMSAEKRRYWKDKLEKIANPQLNNPRVLQYLAARATPGFAPKRPADDQAHRHLA